MSGKYPITAFAEAHNVTNSYADGVSDGFEGYKGYDNDTRSQYGYDQGMSVGAAVATYFHKDGSQ